MCYLIIYADSLSATYTRRSSLNTDAAANAAEEFVSETRV